MKSAKCKPNCHPVCLFVFIFYGEVVLWPISSAVKRFAAKIFMVEPPRPHRRVSRPRVKAELKQVSPR